LSAFGGPRVPQELEYALELWGNLRDFSLPDIIQLVGFGRKTGALSVEHKGIGSMLYFQQGNVVHAEMGDVEGQEAVFRLFRLTDGEFRFRADVQPSHRTIFMDPTNLVMEAARLLDESTRGQYEQEEPAAVEVVEEVEAAPAPRPSPPSPPHQPVPESAAPKTAAAQDMFVATDYSAVDQIDSTPRVSPDEIREEIRGVLEKRLGREAKRLLQAVDKCGDSYEEFQQLVVRVERFVSAFVDPKSGKKIGAELDSIIRLLAP
jgi:hypothetical protein